MDTRWIEGSDVDLEPDRRGSRPECSSKRLDRPVDSPVETHGVLLRRLPEGAIVGRSTAIEMIAVERCIAELMQFR
jgi:hypothetical protein